MNLFQALGLEPDRKTIISLSTRTQVPMDRLLYYQKHDVIPTGTDLERLCTAVGIDQSLLKLRMGVVDASLIKTLSQEAERVLEVLPDTTVPQTKKAELLPVFETKHGRLYQSDCMDLLRAMPDESVDVCFADPPFNLDKLYPSQIDDNLKEHQYIEWCYAWLEECVRVLKTGGSLLVWNLPKWNVLIASFLMRRLTFRDWIAVDLKYHLPIKGRLYPSHYSLLYFCKGERPNTFAPDRLPMETCKSCGADLKDYGGYKSKMNPAGVSMTDVWYDIPPVRHKRYKRRQGANELPIKLIDRIIEMTSVEGDLIFDPFGGSGTTYVVAELKERRWVGCEIGPTDDIVSRFGVLSEEQQILKAARSNYNQLIPPAVKKIREKNGKWTLESLNEKRSTEVSEMTDAQSALFPIERKELSSSRKRKPRA